MPSLVRIVQTCILELHIWLWVDCVSAGTLLRNYGAIKVAPAQNDRPLLSSKRRSHCRTHKRFWNKQKLRLGFRRGSKPKTILLARANIKVLNWTALEASELSSWVICEPAAIQQGLEHGSRSISIVEAVIRQRLMRTKKTLYVL
jgi:hypothetical protein